MNDRAFSDPDVRAALSEWGALTRQVEELRREVAEEVEIIGLIAAERDALRRERDALNTLLDGSLAREREADRAVRDLLALINLTPKGVARALWAKLTRRTR
jgi:hypothetical protein